MKALRANILKVAILAACAWTGAAQAQVYRCGNSYSQEPCKGGKAVDTTPPVASHGGNGASATQTIYLCSSKSGTGMFWSSAHCHQHNAWIERTENVPTNMGWDDQVALAQSQRNAAAALSRPPQQGYVQQAAQPQGVNNKQACAVLEQRVKDLDSMGRAGSLIYNLDWLRSERKAARDEQFRLRC